LPKEGRGEVVGVDFAKLMIDIAEELAKEGVADRCDFRVGAFPKVLTESAVRCFDRQPFRLHHEPVPIIAKMRELTSKMILSFPAIGMARSRQACSFWMKGTPLFFIVKNELKILASGRCQIMNGYRP